MYLDEDDEEYRLANIASQPFLKSWPVQIGGIVGFAAGVVGSAILAGILYLAFPRTPTWVLAFLLIPIGLIAGGVIGAIYNAAQVRRRNRRLKKRDEREARRSGRRQRREVNEEEFGE